MYANYILYVKYKNHNTKTNKTEFTSLDDISLLKYQRGNSELTCPRSHFACVSVSKSTSHFSLTVCYFFRWVSAPPPHTLLSPEKKKKKGLVSLSCLLLQHFSIITLFPPGKGTRFDYLACAFGTLALFCFNAPPPPPPLRIPHPNPPTPRKKGPVSLLSLRFCHSCIIMF